MSNPLSGPLPPSHSGQGPASTPPSQGGAQPPAPDSPYMDSLVIWQKFLSVGGQEATIEQAKQFQALVIKAMCSQIQQEQQRAVAAIRKMKQDNEESQG